MNPPDHGRIRDIANKGFRPSHLAALRAFIQQQIDRLLRDVDVTQPFELMGSFSSLFAPEIVGELIGLPHDKRPLIAEQTSRQLRGVDPGASYEQRLDSARARHEMCDYVREVIAERRAAPRDDFITALVQSSDEQKTTSDAELTALVQILYVGGYETTSHMIGNGIVALLSNPEQYALLCAEPKRISEAVDEMLRFDGPIATTVLVAGEGATIDGSPVKAGTLCFGLLGAANHDPSVFEHPERFDITRRRSKHLAFGTGIHFCLGAGLARVELELVFSEFTRRFPRMKLLQPADELRRLPVFHQRAYEQVPLLLEP